MAVRITSRVPASTKSSSTKSNQNTKKSSKLSKSSSKNTKTVVQTAKKTSTSAKTAAQKASDIAREEAMAAKKADEKAREAAMRTKKTGANSQSSKAANITTSAGITAKSSPTTVQSKPTISSGIGKLTGVRYLKDAPMIYTASGQAASYNSPGKSDTSKNSNTSNQMPVKSSIGVSSFTYGRPEESYKSQKKTKSTDVKKVSLPIALQKPVKAKGKTKAGDTKKKRKVYFPSDSRSGPGKMFYRKKTNPTGEKEGASFLTSFLPFVGDAKDVQEAVTGKDLITGKKLSKIDQIITAGTIVLPVISGKSVRAVKSGAKAIKKPAKKVVKATFETAEKTTEKAAKTIEKKSGKAAKNLKNTGKKLADGFDEAGKKINKTVKENAKIEMDPVSGVKKSKGGSGSKIYSPVEYEGTVKVNGEVRDVSRKVYQRNDIDFDYFDETTGLTNLERMQAGKPPIGTDGNAIQLHHVLQKEVGPMAEIREVTH